MRSLILAFILIPMATGIASADFVGSGGGFSIPDNDPVGISSDIVVPVSETITDVNVTLEASPIPEPASLGIIGLASLGLAFYRRRK